MRKEPLLISLSQSSRTFILSTIAVSSPYFLSSKGLDPIQISIIVLFSLALSTFFLYLYTIINMGIKQKLLLLSILLSTALFILLYFQSVFAFIASIIIGGISLGGRDFATNQSLEKYTISTYTEVQKEKNFLFSIYNFLSYGSGAVASAFLFLIPPDSFLLIFEVIFLISLIQIIIYLILEFPEMPVKEGKNEKNDDINVKAKKEIFTLSAIFSLDALGGGLVNSSIISLWFDVVYHTTLSQTGFIFIIVNIITAFSVIISSFISGSIGLVKTMVYTHLISNVFLFMVPVFHLLPLSEIFLFLRQSTSQMDVPARDSFINSYFTREDRIRANSSFLAARNGGQIPGPGLAGLFLEVFPAGVFMAGAAIKISYDILFFIKYRHYRT